MNKHYLPFELCKLLKEKGFNISTQKAYINNNLFIKFEKSYGESEFYFDADDFYEDWNKKDCVFTKDGSGCFGCKLDNIKYFEAYSAPELHEVVQWLYETHGIWISVKKDYYNGESLGFEYIIDDAGGIIGSENFKTPQEAYTTAIQYCLENLI